MLSFLTDKITDIRSDLLPELETRFGEIYSEINKNKIFFRFRSEENALCGQTAIAEYVKTRKIPGNVTPSSNKTIILVIREEND